MAWYVFFSGDVRRAVVGLLTATIETAIHNGAGNVEHCAGLLTLGKGLALSFGLDWLGIVGDVRAALTGPGAVELLDIASNRMLEGNRK